MSLHNSLNRQPKSRDERRKVHQTSFEGESLTVQAEKDACCVNNILARYRKTGLIDHIKQHEGRYGDFSTATDFQEAMSVVVQAQQSFDLLPSEIRQKFSNDPAQFLEFVHNPENKNSLVEMGLADAPPPSPEALSTRQAEGEGGPPKEEEPAD